MATQPVHPHTTTSNQAFLANTEPREQARQVNGLSISVILCTYNRRNMVLSALSSLRKQSLSNASFEVIVVDNGSTDGTFEAVQAFIERNTRPAADTTESWRAQCLQEMENGLAYARNKGVQAAAGKILFFLDDDTLADTALLERLLRAYQEIGAEVIGGCVELRWEAVRPYWLSNELLEMLGYFVPFRTRCELPETICLSNACFSLTREALQRVGGFTPFLSKRLHMPINSDIVDLCQRLREAGYALWYEPAAVVRHRVTRPRLDRAFIAGRAYWQGRAEILTEYWHDRQRAMNEGTNVSTRTQMGRAIRDALPDLGESIRLALVHQPLLFLAKGASHERLGAALELSYHWGRLQQQLLLLKNAPALEVWQPVSLGQLPARKQAREYLGLAQDGFVYLCLADQHTERELLRLITAFEQAYQAFTGWEGYTDGTPQLLIAGEPQDRPEAQKLLRSAALVTGVHMYLAGRMDTLAWLMGAADALVQAYVARTPMAGTIDIARLFHAHQRVVIAPDMPLLREKLPAQDCLLYDPASQEALTEVLLGAQGYGKRRRKDGNNS